MAQTYDRKFDVNVDRAVAKLQKEQKRKPIIAAMVVAVGLIVGAGAAYLSYRDVPAPDHPANARPHLVEPYR